MGVVLCLSSVSLSPYPSRAFPLRHTLKMVSADELKEKITAALDPTHIEVTDTSGGCGSAFEVVIVSKAFEGKRLLQKHRLVNDALKDVMPDIHAFSQKTLTPQEWEASKAQ